MMTPSCRHDESSLCPGSAYEIGKVMAFNRFAFMACGFLVLLPGSFSRAAEVRISELVAAASADGLVDAEGEPADWIELHNAGPDSVSLADWALTDDPERPSKWPLPDVVLDAGTFVVFIASGKDAELGDEWHTNFKLDRSGEYLALSNANGEMVSALSPGYPPLSDGVSYGYDSAMDAYRVWRTPTPGSLNGEAPDLGPFLFQPGAGTELAQQGKDHEVSVRVLPNGHPIESVTLKYRVMYKGEISVPMEARDGRYTGLIPAFFLFGERYHAGEMLRWAFQARDSAGRETRLPSLPEDEEKPQAEYFGTIVADPSIDSPLPQLHWFAEDPDNAVTERGSRASVYFEGQFYDDLFVRRRGQFGAIDWPKAKLKFDFNPGDHFRYDADRRRVEEFNLQSHFRDASFMRENLAFAFFNHIGTPASDTRHWHVRFNGSFHGLFSFVEQVDEDFLRQQGLDPEGALYKANGFPSTLAKGVTRALYQKETRKDEPYDDLVEFTDGINGVHRFDYIMDHVNLPAMVNEMAGQSVIRNADRLTKNYYMYRDPETDLWQRIPWDMDGAFSTSSGLANENFASPLYGDSQHTQAAGQPIYQNFLLDAILDHKLTRQMYLRRLRSLIDAYLSEEPVYFKSAVDERTELIRQDARDDAAMWGTGNIDSGTRTIKNTALSLRREELLETYGKDLVPPRQTPGLELTVGEVDPAPGDSQAEYFQLINPNNEAIDLSGWSVSGAVAFVFPSGTVIPQKGTLFSPDDGFLHVVKNVRAFRERSTGPGGGQGLFYVGGYEGRLSTRGETIRILDDSGRLVVEHTYESTTPVATYDAWVEAHFSEEERLDESLVAWDADPNGEGVSNLYRYAFGDQFRIEVVRGHAVVYRRISQASDLEFVLEGSGDLETWRELEFAEKVVADTEAEERYETIEALLNEQADDGESYFRIRVRLLDLP